MRQLVLVLLVLEPQLPLPTSVAMASLDSLQTVLDLADQLLQIVRLELLVELLDAVLDSLVQLKGLWFRDRQVTHELGAVLPVSPIIFISHFFQNVRIKIRSIVCATVGSGRLALKFWLRALLRPPRRLMAFARLHPLLLHFGVQIVELELAHDFLRQLLELFLVFRVKYVLTAGSVQDLEQCPDRVRDSCLKCLPRLADL